jgi:hypothetical protein
MIPDGQKSLGSLLPEIVLSRLPVSLQRHPRPAVTHGHRLESRVQDLVFPGDLIRGEIEDEYP